MPTTEQLIAWGTTALVVLTGIVNGYRKRRRQQTNGGDDDLPRLRAENEWLWDEVTRLRGMLAGAGAEPQTLPALRAAIQRAMRERQS